MVKRFLLVILLTLVLFVLWNWSVIASLLRPTLVRQGIVATPTVAQLTPNTVVYDSLGIVAPLTINAGTSPLIESDWSVIRTALTQGVSLAYDGDSFETTRLAFVTGHSSDATKHAYDSIFAPLGQAKPGDIFRIAVEDAVYQYRVDQIQELSPTSADAFLALQPTSGPSRLALVTCWPPLTTKMRLVVLGERL
ncbi:MAG: sortase [Patescibacteria group bacterium]